MNNIFVNLSYRVYIWLKPENMRNYLEETKGRESGRN